MTNQSFDTVQEQIEIFFQQNQVDDSFSFDKSFKLKTSDAIFCAKDKFRNKQFWNAIENVIKTGNKSELIFVDAGSGTGILGLFALILGAKKCYFIETNPLTINFSKKLLKLFGQEKKCKFINEDACKLELPEKFDVLISETITSGFVQEDFCEIINNLKKYSNEKAIFIPESFEVEIFEKTSKKIHKIKIKTRKLANEKIPIILENKNTKTVKFTMQANLFEGISLKSGDCISFINSRDFDLEKNHKLFKFE